MMGSASELRIELLFLTELYKSISFACTVNNSVVMSGSIAIRQQDLLLA